MGTITMLSFETESPNKNAAWQGMLLDMNKFRADFPIFAESVNGKPLVYLDSAATTQKPRCVIDRVANFYAAENANIHRGVHRLSMEATEAYEKSRRRIASFLGASDAREIVFVRGTTEGINLIAQTLGRSTLGPGDEILITGLEHHSNIVPWQILCEQTGAVLRVASIDDRGEVIREEYTRLLSEKTKLVALSHVSNALGTINPVREMIAQAHEYNVPVLVDGAQAVPHMAVDVREMDCDFYVFSGHKMFGPTGIGALYGKASWLKELPPYQGGGDMIASVTFDKTIYAEVPAKFEAGTPNISGAIGLGEAIRYLQDAGMDRIAAYERELLEYATSCLMEMNQIRLIGTAQHKASVVSFVVDGVHAHDIGSILDMQGIAIRAGHHCAQPIMDRFGVPATVRASLAFYNTKGEIDALVTGLKKAIEMFG